MASRWIAVVCVLGALSLAAWAPRPVEGSGSPIRIVVILADECGAECVCPALTTYDPGGPEADCVAAQEIGIPVPSEDGCCADTGNCPGPPDGCVMATRTFRYRLALGEDCACTKADITTTGADSGQNQTGLSDSDNWSQNFTMGGFALFCSTVDSRTRGGITITCTSGGTPTPRVLAVLVIDYECFKCAG
jgi:hypothetical protein